MTSNDTANSPTQSGLPAPEIDLAGAFASSSSVDHTRGLGGMGRRRRAATGSSTPSQAERGSEAPASTPGSEETARRGSGAPDHDANDGAADSPARERGAGELDETTSSSAGEPDRTRDQDAMGEGRGDRKPSTSRTSAKAPATSPAKSAAATKKASTASAGTGAPTTRSTQQDAGESSDRATGRPSATKGGVAYVPAATRDLLARLRGEKGRTFGELVITALNAQHSRLGELVQQRRPEVVSGPLFTMSAKPERAATVQVTLRLSQAHWEVIDRLVGEYGAANRGELIDAAMQAEFGA